MTINGREELHNFVQIVVGAFLVSARQEQLAEEAKAFLSSARCGELEDRFMDTLAQALATRVIQERRGDPFRRLLCHPLTELLESDQISRNLLPNYFNFLHLVLGDQLGDFAHQCEEILLDIKREPHFTWDFFYDDPRAKKVLWDVLMRVAETFKRFDIRRDWFISLMQNRTHAVSLASNAFIPLPRGEEEEPAQFGPTEFNLMFAALFRPLLSLSATESGHFTKLFGAPPTVLIRPLVENLL